MLVIRVEEWPGGDQGDVNPIARLDIANLSGLAPVSDYEVLLRRGMGPGPILARGIVRGHRREDGWLPLARAAMRAVDPDGGFYSSPVTQVSADVLAVLPLAPYVSRACQTGRAILSAGPDLDRSLAARGLERQAWAREFFSSCRVTEKWTKLQCQDPSHGDSGTTAEQLSEGAPLCTWPACLPEDQQQQLADDVTAGMLGEPTGPGPDPRVACGCVDPAGASVSRVWTVTTMVTAPTPADAERWASGISEMVRAEFGDSMRLDVTVAPVAPARPPAARAAADKECECGRDERVRGYLPLLAGADEAAAG